MAKRVSIFMMASIFFFAGPPLASAATDPSNCPAGFARFGRKLTGKVRLLAAEHAAQARLRVGVRLRDLAEKQNQYPLGWGASRPYGSIEPVAAAVMPKDPTLAAIAVRVNEMFQNEKEILSFVESMALRAGEFHAVRSAPTFNPKVLIPKRDYDASFLQIMAHEQGWGEIALAKEILEPNDHRLQILGTGRLHFDLETAGGQHASTAHILQWLMITPKLEKEFGPGAARKFLQYMSTREGYGLWITTFDRGPTYFRDFRGPHSFAILEIAGPRSWLGVP